RVMFLVAGAGLGKALPKIPEGGLWTLLTPPRYAAEGGLLVSGATTTATVMADGTLIVTGVATGTAITSASSSFGGACADGSQKKEGYEWHHLATNKNDTSSARGGPWTPLFGQLFAKAGMTLDDPANRVYLKGHRGPHPEEYHAAVHDRLQVALRDCTTVALCGNKLREALAELTDKLCTPNSYLNRLLTKP
ncbi:AHH domain-containing protein, partial [Archangium sp.]|uniref:AHH domain-containing protein n=1 Tax=Archangium sp. TaxID=1872627 RepID=UPI002ED9DC57